MENKKKAPSWATAVGVFGVCFGVLGLLGGTYQLLMPMMMDMQAKMMTSMKEAAKESAGARQKEADPECPESADVARPSPDASFDAMEKMLQVPPWYKTWAIANGTLALLLGAAYILASIFLLSLRAWAPTAFMAVLAASLLRNATSFGLALSAGSFMAFWSLYSSVIGFLIDLVLLIVILVSDRSAYSVQTD